MMNLTRRLLPARRFPLDVIYASQLHLDCQEKTAELDGVRHPVKLGSWMFYLPDIQAKLFHAAGGRIDCIHPSRPPDDLLGQRGLPLGRYTSDEWLNALTTPVFRRLAEVWLVSVRLWQAGLGPQPLGVIFVDAFVRGGIGLGPSGGILSQNVYALPRKLPCKLEQIEAAGVIPDRILSCVRQQERGYVVDLCSVVGCLPVNAMADVERLELIFRQKPSAVVLEAALDATFQASSARISAGVAVPV